MFSMPKRAEIDHHTMRLIIGAIAFLLPILTYLTSMKPLHSISASYHEGGLARDIFVGFLFAIAAFLFTYNGKSTFEMRLSKIVAVATLFVATFPCECETHSELIPYVHGVSAIVMFVSLALFCHHFATRASAKGHSEAMRRATIYKVCGIIIIVSILLVLVDSLLDLVIRSLVFWSEAIALAAFGVAWVTSSLAVPIITNKEERHPLLPVRDN